MHQHNYYTPTSPLAKSSENRRGQDNAIVELNNIKRVWAIPAIHSEVERLIDLHDRLLELYTLGDRIIYLGNYTGYGDYATETIDELLTFRRLILSIHGVFADDLLYLRGGQEEMLSKLLQLNFAPNPEHVLLWMLSRGLSPTLNSYGIDIHDGILATKEGALGLNRWIGRVRHLIRQHAGHEDLHSHLKHAVVCRCVNNQSMIFVNSGYDLDRNLNSQGDNFWWPSKNFDTMEYVNTPFQKIFRGFDPQHKGVCINNLAITLDNACGFGGSLMCAGIDPDGDVFELFEC